MPLTKHITLIENQLNDALEALDDAAEDDASIHDINEARRLTHVVLELFHDTLNQCDTAGRRQLQLNFSLRMTYLRSRLLRMDRLADSSLG